MRSKSTGLKARVRIILRFIDTTSFGICPAVLILCVENVFQKASTRKYPIDAPVYVRLWERVGTQQKTIHNLSASSRGKHQESGGPSRQELTREQRRERPHEGREIHGFLNRHYRSPEGRCIMDEFQQDSVTHIESLAGQIIAAQ